MRRRCEPILSRPAAVDEPVTKAAVRAAAMLFRKG